MNNIPRYTIELRKINGGTVWSAVESADGEFYSVREVEAARQAPAPVEVSRLAEEVRLKTLEAAARACEKLAEERFNDHGTREPDTGACYYGGRVEEEYQARDEEDDECAKAIRALAIVPAPRFPMTYCSQCGSEQGPGDEGVSHCSDHRVNRLASSASTPVGEVPAGWVLVPRKSTDAMRYAWMEVYDEKGWNAMQSMWDAVLAAAPKFAASPAPAASKGAEADEGVGK